MCAIISWNGALPKGLLTQLLLKSERRGHDSTGLAFRLADSTVSYRQAVPSSEFVSEPDNNKFLGDARRSKVGIAHTRRASPGMPIDNRNAHPFLYWQYFFAHNGKIQNWVELKESLVAHFSRVSENSTGSAKDTADWCVNYCRSTKTDSKILGPYIHTEDFSQIVGCMALVWMRGAEAFVTRMAKEATSATIAWRYTAPPKGEVAEDQIVTVVGSTHEIIEESVKALERTIDFDIGPFNDFPEGVIYRLEPTGLVEHKRLTQINAVEDAYTSEEVDPDPTPVVAESSEASQVVEPPTA